MVPVKIEIPIGQAIVSGHGVRHARHHGQGCVIHGHVGAFVAFISYQARLIAPIQNILTLYTNLATLKVSAQRVFELLDAKPEVTDGEKHLDESVEAIEFRDVSFRHDRESVLTGATFTLPVGSFCVVVGPSGAGKSSMVKELEK